MADEDVLLVIVGAGASYAAVGESADGALNVEGWPSVPGAAARPPLTQSLVGRGPLQDQVLSWYPQAKPLVAELRAVLAADSDEATVSFERLLEDYDASAADDPVRRTHLTALRFYLRDLLWACTDYAKAPAVGGGITTYHRLVNELHRWARMRGRHVCFVNFNYDLILENACADAFGFNTTDFRSYLADPYVSVVKPHGAVNWEWPQPHIQGSVSRKRGVARVIAAAATRADFDTSKMTVAPPPRATDGPFAPAGVPAIALPLATKHAFTWPAEQAEHFAMLATRVRGIVTLGWRGIEPHFTAKLPPLVRSGARVVVVTGGRDAESDAVEVTRRLREPLEPTYVEFRHHTQGLPESLAPLLDWVEPGFTYPGIG